MAYRTPLRMDREGDGLSGRSPQRSVATHRWPQLLELLLDLYQGLTRMPLLLGWLFLWCRRMLW